MKLKDISCFFLLAVALVSCTNDDDQGGNGGETPTEINFRHVTTINAGGTTEITAFDPATNKMFTINPDDAEVMVYDISDPSSPVAGTSIQVGATGIPNSVSVHGERLAVAVEAVNKQDNGSVLVYNTDTQELEDTFTVGALPDMVIFSPDGKYIVTANEGEPDPDYTNDPEGTISIIDTEANTVTTLDFNAFNSEEETLRSEGFRVFGPGATLAMDIEPEYVAIDDDSQTAWVTLQENNGIARVNLSARQIEDIYPLGFKDHSLAGNELDASNRDDVTELKNWPVYGIYHPDAVIYVNLDGTDYLITANEGDARDYDGFSEEERIKDITLDGTVFPDAETLQQDENLGRLKITTTLGDTDGDGEYEALYAYGARSFSVWSAAGELVYDSGSEIASRTLELTPGSFNADEGEADDRSDDKGAEPEAVEKLRVGDRTLLFVGLERNSQVLVYDVSNPVSPEFIQLLEQPGDMAPEGVLAIPAEDSPNERDLLIVTNEDSGTISIYQN